VFANSLLAASCCLPRRFEQSAVRRLNLKHH
jgi:hypothetical protein